MAEGAPPRAPADEPLPRASSAGDDTASDEASGAPRFPTPQAAVEAEDEPLGRSAEAGTPHAVESDGTRAPAAVANRAPRRLAALLDDPRAGLTLVLAAAALARALVLASLARWPWFEAPVVDSAVYHQMARAFAGGDLLIGHEPLRMSPAYPFFLGLVYRLLGDGPWPIRLVQAALGVALAGLTWDTARRLWGTRWALAAGLPVALFGPLLFHEAQLLGDGPAAALAGLWLWLTVRALAGAEGEGWLRWLLPPLALAALIALRPNAVLLLLPLAAAAWLARAAHRGRAVALSLLVVALALTPLSLRNRLAAGTWSPLASHGGLNLFIGNGPGANGTYRTPAEIADADNPADQFTLFHRAAERAEGRPLSPREADRHWYARALVHVTDHPGAALLLLGRKTNLYLNAQTLTDVVSYAFTRREDPVMGLPWPGFGLLTPFALLGVLVALGPWFWSRPRRGEERRAEIVIALANITFAAGVIAIFVVDRYRLPALPFLALAAVMGVRALLEAVRARAPRVLAPRAAILLGALALAWPVGVRDATAREWWKTAAQYEKLGRLDQAAAAYAESLALDPTNFEAAERFAALLRRTGRTEAARQLWQRVAAEARKRGDAEAAHRALAAGGLLRNVQPVLEPSAR